MSMTQYDYVWFNDCIPSNTETTVKVRKAHCSWKAEVESYSRWRLDAGCLLFILFSGFQYFRLIYYLVLEIGWVIPFDLDSMGPFKIHLGAQGSLWQEAVVDDTYHWSSIGHFSHYHLATIDCREFNGLHGCPLHPWPIDEHHRSTMYVSTRTDAQQRKSSLSFQQRHVQHLYHAHVLVMQSAHFDNGLAPWVPAVGGYTLDSWCCHCLSRLVEHPAVASGSFQKPSGGLPGCKIRRRNFCNDFWRAAGNGPLSDFHARLFTYLCTLCKICKYRTHVYCFVIFESYLTYPHRIREGELKPM